MTLAAPLPSPAWGNLIGAYFVIIGLPSGLGLLTWWMTVNRQSNPALERTANAISLTALVVVSAILVADLGRPERFYLMLTSFDRMGSPISVGAKLISVKVALLGLTIYADERSLRQKVPTEGRALSHAAPRGQQIVRAALGMASFALALYPASVLSRTWSSPLAASSGSAILFTLTALLLGAGTISALSTLLPAYSAVRETARRTMAVLLAAYTIAIVFEFLAISGDPRWHTVGTSLALGPDAVPFWAGVIGIGIVLPAGLLAAAPKRRAALAVTAVAVIAGASIARYLIFSAGA